MAKQQPVGGFRGEVKSRMYKKAKQWLIDALSQNDAQGKVDKLIVAAYDKVDSPGILSSIFDSAEKIAKIEIKKEFAIQVTKSFVSNNKNIDTTDFEHWMKDDKFTLARYITDTLKMKGIEWKTTELLKKAKDDVSKLKTEISKPPVKIPFPKLINPEIPNISFINPNIGVPEIKLDSLDINLPTLDISVSIDNLPNLGFSTDISVPIPLVILNIGFPNYFLQKVFLDLVVDLSLSAPFFALAKSTAKLVDNGKSVVKGYLDLVNTELTSAMKENISQFHVMLSDSILSEAWHSQHAKAAKFTTHLADFAGSLTPAGFILNPSMATARFGIEIYILGHHYMEVRAITKGTKMKTLSNNIFITKSLMKRHSIVACALLDKIDMYSMFGMSQKTKDIPEMKSNINEHLKKINKNLDPAKMTILMFEIYEAYFKRLLKISRKIEGDLPYKVTYK